MLVAEREGVADGSSLDFNGGEDGKIDRCIVGFSRGRGSPGLGSSCLIDVVQNREEGKADLGAIDLGLLAGEQAVGEVAAKAGDAGGEVERTACLAADGAGGLEPADKGEKRLGGAVEIVLLDEVAGVGHRGLQGLKWSKGACDSGL